MAVDYPILLLTFNRPAVTRKVFEVVRQRRPRQLFVSADGPRDNKPGEKEQCQLVRDIFSEIDWDCDLQTKFSDINQGCAKGVSSALTWFFNNVEAGIILEDDCVPDASFFDYCSELLTRYREDERIMLISGDNFQRGHRRGDASYYFSRIAHIWGWATWRRTWDKFDLALNDRATYMRAVEQLHPDAAVHKYFSDLLDKVYSKELDTWAIPLMFSIMREGGLCINPQVNLVSNIGFGDVATHTVDDGYSLANLPTHNIGELKHATHVKANREADEFTLRNVYGIPIQPPSKWSLFRLFAGR